MPKPRLRGIHKAGLRVLKAMSASIRLQILNLLLDHGPMSYTEIMGSLRLDATRDAGRFAYHLRSLMKADLVEPSAETKKYSLTDLGRRVIEITDEIEKQTYKRARMLVRTSRFSIEEFDRSKIARSLIIEASVPTELAQKIAREAEKRLQQFKTKYLTAPLIREVVNAILLEKHYEEYRHKLTRLGLPVHEVTNLFQATEPNVEAIHNASGDAVIEEYTLLNVLPRDISDAYLSGSLHLNELGTWILKPNEISHSLPYFLRASKPKTLEAAINLTTNLVRNVAAEAKGQQNLSDFNVHMAQYSKDMDPERIRGLLRLLVKNLNQALHTPVTIGIELVVDSGIPYAQEAREFATCMLEALAEENRPRPLVNPKIVLRNCKEAFSSGETEGLLFEAHKLASTSSIVYFSNDAGSPQDHATYTASGMRLATDWHGDPDLDTVRTGNLDQVGINLPRISFEAQGEQEKFFEILEDRIRMARQALGVKHQQIKKQMKNLLLPSLAIESNGGRYFRLENATQTIALIGLTDAVRALAGEQPPQDLRRALESTERILKHALGCAKRHAKKPRTRLTTAIVPNERAAKRLAKLDIEKYGWGIIAAGSSKENPFYSDAISLSPSRKEGLELEERTQQLTPGGHLALIEAGDQTPSPEVLVSTTKKLTSSLLRFFTYDLAHTYCPNCQTTSAGTTLKCPRCGSTGVHFSGHFPRVERR